MGTGEAGGMRPRKLGVNKGRVVGHGDARVGARADVDGAFGKPRNDVEPLSKIIARIGDDRLGVGRERVGVDRGHEQRLGPRSGSGHLAEGPRAKGRPETGHAQLLLDRIGAEPGQRRSVDGAEIHGIVAVQVDDHGLQHASMAAVHDAHHAGARRGEVDARHLLVREQRLAEADAVTRPYGHPRFQAVIVLPQQRDTLYRTRILDLLFGLAAQRDVESPANAKRSDFLHGLMSPIHGRLGVYRIRHPLRSSVSPARYVDQDYRGAVL